LSVWCWIPSRKGPEVAAKTVHLVLTIWHEVCLTLGYSRAVLGPCSRVTEWRDLVGGESAEPALLTQPDPLCRWKGGP
jgi:hypothetical protein